MWRQTRWQTYWMLKMMGAGLQSPEELLPLQGDKKVVPKEISDKEKKQLEELVQECQEFNRQQEIKKEAE